MTGHEIPKFGGDVRRPLPRTVLVVDDEALVRAYVKTVLQGDGFQILDAADGVDALALLQETGGAVDVLVTDIKMPRMTGTDLVKAVNSAFPGIPVVYISGEELEPELHNPQRRIVFLQKPILPQALLEAVRGMISESAVRAGITA